MKLDFKTIYMRLFSLFCCIFLCTLQVSAQTKPLWKVVQESEIRLAEGAVRPFVPNAYSALELDYASIKKALSKAPREFTQAGHDEPVRIQLPNADNTLETYAVTESPLFSDGDYARYPDVKTYNGYSLDTPGKVTRFSLTMLGFNAIVISPNKSAVIVEPIAKGQTKYYMAYKTTDFPEELWPKLPNVVVDEQGNEVVPTTKTKPAILGALAGERGAADPVKLKIYKFACATTGEFGIDHGGTAASVLAAMTNYLNQLNALYEYDLAVRLIFVDNVASIFFFDPLTDPYTGVTVFDWMGQNPAAMNMILGPTGYDIGHVFARYISGDAGGVAGGLGCTQLGKGRGCSAGNGAYGIGFLTTVGQEIGHQWTGGHTWNRCGSVGGRNGLSAFEPGSGSTIMSYGGSCGSDNVQNGSDLYYHAGSIDEIRKFVETGLGAGCGTEVTSTNRRPVVKLPYQNGFFIPISTPFEVRGEATDEDGDAMTYCWEGMDAGQEVALGAQAGTSALYRTFPPSATLKNRVFPRLSSIISNQIPKAELLPTNTRDMTLRLTVRDNKNGGGGVGFADLEFRATDLAGPFLVTSPNSIADIITNTTCTKVTWNVANTDKSPVNCKKVNIRLSTDGGNTYPTTLATGEANDGVAYVTFPAGTTSNTARIRIDAGDNIFFDISNANFKLVAPTAPSFGLCQTTDSQKICLPESFKTTFSAIGVAGFSGAINLSITSGLPIGAVANFSKTVINPGETSELTINNTSALTEGTYDIVVTAVSGTQTEIRNIKLTLVSNVFTDFKLLTPLNASDNASQTPTLTWSTVPDGDTYEVEVSTSAGFEPSNIVASKSALTVGSWSIPLLLKKAKVYFWRVRPINDCGTQAWSSIQSFVTLNEACVTADATDLPKNISTSGSVTVSSQLFISGGAVSDVNVKKVGLFHDLFKDLKFTLTHPDGTTIILAESKCGNSSGNWIFGFDDSAPNTLLCPPGNAGTAYRPQNPLSLLNGKPAQGTWKMDVFDSSPGGGGAFNAFEVEVCAAAIAKPPFIVNNNVLQVQGGANAVISDNLLKADDTDNTPAQIKFILLSNTQYGHLEINGGGPLKVGATFTQADINAGALRYFHYGSGKSDQFSFVITDDNGGLFGTPVFKIQPQNVATQEPEALSFRLAPNPVDDLLTIRLDEAISNDAQATIYSVEGRLVQQVKLTAGTQTKQIDVTTLNAGLYFIQVTDGLTRYNAKFVKG
jgi:subtilisin-like proprotein convertase family protein